MDILELCVSNVYRVFFLNPGFALSKMIEFSGL